MPRNPGLHGKAFVSHTSLFFFFLIDAACFAWKRKTFNYFVFPQLYKKSFTMGVRGNCFFAAMDCTNMFQGYICVEAFSAANENGF